MDPYTYPSSPDDAKGATRGGIVIHWGTAPSDSMAQYTFRDLAEKTDAMREFRRLRDAGLPVPAEVRDRHVQATNDGYATGPNPGERIPDFALPDQTGSIRSLRDLTGPSGLFLVFHRSADW